MNTRRMNRLEELGRVDAEKADTRKGKRNLREEKSRIVRELKAKGGKVGSQDADTPRRPRAPRKKMGPGAASPKRKMGPDARDKKRGKFPDLTGDGKVTRADVLRGRGVFKSGGMAKRGRGCEIR